MQSCYSPSFYDKVKVLLHSISSDVSLKNVKKECESE